MGNAGWEKGSSGGGVTPTLGIRRNRNEEGHRSRGDVSKGAGSMVSDKSGKWTGICRRFLFKKAGGLERKATFIAKHVVGGQRGIRKCGDSMGKLYSILGWGYQQKNSITLGGGGVQGPSKGRRGKGIDFNLLFHGAIEKHKRPCIAKIRGRELAASRDDLDNWGGAGPEYASLASKTGAQTLTRKGVTAPQRKGRQGGV